MNEQALSFGPMTGPIDVTQLMAHFKLPGIDMSAVVDARRKDIDALVEANRLAFESMQAISRRQTDMLMHAMQQLQAGAGNALLNAKEPARQAETVKETFELVLANMKELADMARQAQVDVMAPVTERVAQQMHGLKNPAKAA